MTEMIGSIVGIWLMFSFIGFLLFGIIHEISYRFTKTGKFVFYVVSAIVELPLLAVMFVLWVLWLLAYPLHLIFVKKEYRKSFIGYAFFEERL